MFRSSKNKKAGIQPATSSPSALDPINPTYSQQLSVTTDFDHMSPGGYAMQLPNVENGVGISPISPMPPSLPPIQRVSSIISVKGEGEDGLGYVRLSSADSWFHTPIGGQLENSQQHTGGDTQINFSRPRRDTGSSMSSVSKFHFRRESDESWAQHGNDLRPIREEAREMTDVRPDSSMNAIGNGSPLHSRPLTAESGRKSHYAGSDASSFRGVMAGGSNAPSIVMMGPFQEPVMSPSKFPIDSHRPPPKPPVHSFIATPVLEPPLKPSKGRLSFLNKLKRRGGSAGDIGPDDVPKRGAYPGLPDNFDPSIRGNRVHDFSAPRAPAVPTNRQTYSSPSYGTSGRDIGIGWAEEYKPNRLHTPVFREHFDEPHSDDAAVRAEALANRDFIARNSGPLPPPPPARNAPPPPPLQTSFPLQEQNDVSPIYEPSIQSIPEASTIPLSPVAEDPSDFEQKVKRQSSIHRRTSSSRKASGRHVSASSRISRLSSASILSANLPAHMDSRASRFSFQLVSNDSAAQERMLEERHKEREAAKKLAQKDTPAEESEEDNYEYDDMDDFEEDVPTIGEEWSYGGGLGNMTLEDTVSAPTTYVSTANSVDLSRVPVKAPVQGLGILPGAVDHGMPPSVYVPSGVPPQPHGSVQLGEEPYDGDDDLYFDDGLIDEVNFDDTEKFDESVLDDPNHPLYERKPKMPDQQVIPIVNQTLEKNAAVNVLDFTTDPNSSPETLAKYHNILAMAAVKAAEAGRFAIEDDATQPSTAPSITTDESRSRTSKATTVSPPMAAQAESSDKNDSPIQNAGAVFQLPQDYDEYPYASDLSDYDSAFEEDPIIAAANADALANDEEGIYGSEFGFYAKPSPDSNYQDVVFFNGGYFGPKSWGEVKRQRSTREPNLTPITERSEYSARNSFASLHNLTDKVLSSPGSIGGAGSPGIAQLARISIGSWDADKNLEALMKLRRGAFGGSQGSLRSVNSARQVGEGSHHSSSPLATSSAGSFVPRPSSGISPRPNSANRFREVGPVQDDSDGVTETAMEPEAVVTEVEQKQEALQEETEDSDYSDTSDQGENFNSVEEVQGGLLGYHQNDPFLNHAHSNSQSQLVPQPFMISVQEPTPQLAAPDSPPPSEPSSSTSGPGDSLMFSQKMEKKALPSYTSHRPPPLNTSLQPPSVPKGASGTFYSPASTIITEMSSPTKSLKSPIKSGVGSVGRNNGGWRPSHSRQGSDTVAYTQEKDEETGEYRWVLERRRTGEDGVESLIGRAVVENGTI